MKLFDKMKRFYLKKMNNGGFTLVELIVVIAILAILAGIAVPAYSGYVEKANKAADEQLLAQVNQAFAAACATNGEDHYDRIDNPKIEIVNGKVEGGLQNVNENISAAFNDYYEGGEFKVIENLYYWGKSGAFLENISMKFNYGGSTITVSSEDLAMLSISSFLTADGMNPETLMGKVEEIVSFAGAFGEGVYEELFADSAYMEYICDSLGIKVSEYDSLDTAYNVALSNAIMQRAAIEAGVSVEALQSNPDAYISDITEAQNYVLANTAVFYSAHNATQNSEEIMKILTSENPKGTIKDSLKESYGGGLSQASVAYGMYMAYAYSSGDSEKIAKANGNYIDVLNDLDDEGFQDYLKTEQAQTDLEAYLSSMSIISDNSSGNAEAVNNLLVNGFADDELVSILESALNN